MNQILAILPLIFASVASQEKAFIVENGIKYLKIENERLGKPLTDAQINETVTNLATLLIAEESILLKQVTAKAEEKKA